MGGWGWGLSGDRHDPTMPTARQIAMRNSRYRTISRDSQYIYEDTDMSTVEEMIANADKARAERMDKIASVNFRDYTHCGDDSDDGDDDDDELIRDAVSNDDGIDKANYDRAPVYTDPYNDSELKKSPSRRTSMTLVEHDPKMESPRRKPKYKRVAGSISLATAYISLVKGNVGPGCLALPCVFGGYDTGGIIPTTVILLWLGGIALYVPGLLVGSQRNLREMGKDAETFEALAFHSIGRKGAVIVQLFICLLQIGICMVFLNYVGDNLYNGIALTQLPEEGWVFISAGFALAISLGRSVKAFAVFVKIATLAMVIALLSIAFFTIQKASLDFNSNRFNHLTFGFSPDTPAERISIAFGNLAYTSATGTCLILPLGNALDPDDYGRRYLTVVRMALGTAMAIFLLLGVGVSLVFSQSRKNNHFCAGSDSITSVFREMADHPYGDEHPLPIPDVVLDVINAILVVAVLMTFPLQLHPAVEVLEKALNVGPMAANDNSEFRDADVDELSVLLNDTEDSNDHWLGPKIRSIHTGGDEQIDVIHVPLPPRNRQPRGGPIYWRLLRIAVIIVCSLAAAFVPKLSLIISLVGCLTSGTLGMILPVVIDYKIRRMKGMRISRRRMILGIMAIMSGIFAITVGNYYTILAIIDPEAPPSRAHNHTHTLAYVHPFETPDPSGNYYL